MHKCQWGEFSCTRQTGHLKLNSLRNGWIVRTTTGGWICCWANMGLFNCTCCAGQLQEHIKEKGIIVSTFAGQKVQIGAIVATGVYEQLFKITIWSAGKIYMQVCKLHLEASAGVRFEVQVMRGVQGCSHAGASALWSRLLGRPEVQHCVPARRCRPRRSTPPPS